MSGFIDVLLSRLSNGRDQSEIVKTVGDPFRWVPIQLGRARSVIMGKCMLANGSSKRLIVRRSGCVSDMLNETLDVALHYVLTTHEIMVSLPTGQDGQ